MALIGIILADGDRADHTRTGDVHTLQSEGVAFAVQPFGAVAGDGLVNHHIHILTCNTGGHIGVDDQRLVIFSGVDHTAELAFIFIQSKASRNVDLFHSVTGHFRNAANHEGCAIGQGNRKLAVCRHGQRAVGAFKSAGNRIACGIGQGDLCGKGDAVGHIDRSAVGIHHLLGDNQIALAHGSIDEIHFIDEVCSHSTCRNCAQGNTVDMHGLNLVILVGRDFLDGIGRAGGNAGKPEGLVPGQLHGITAVCRHGDLRSRFQRHHIQGSDPAVELAGVGCAVCIRDGDAELELIGSAGLVNIHSLGQLDALCRSDFQQTVITQIHVHIEHIVLLGQIGMEDHVRGLGGILICLFLAVHLQFPGRGAGRNCPCAGLTGHGLESAVPLCRANGGLRHFLVHKYGNRGSPSENVTAVIVLALGIQCTAYSLILHRQHIAVAGLFEYSGVKGVIKPLILLGRGELGKGNLVIIVIFCGNVKLVAPELTGHAVGGHMLTLGDPGNVQLVQIGAQTAFKHQTDGRNAVRILNRYLHIGSLIHIGALQTDFISNQGNQRCRNAPYNRLHTCGDVGTHLHGHVHHVGIFDAAMGFAQEAVGLDLVNRIGRCCGSRIFIPEAGIGAVCLGVPANVVGPVGSRVVLQLTGCKGTGHQSLCSCGVGNTQPGLDRADELVAQSGGVLHRAQTTIGRGCQLGGHHMAVKQGIPQQNALDVLDFHIFADVIGEGNIAGEIGASALQMGGIVTGLENDLIHDRLERVAQARAGSSEILIYIRLAGYIGVLGNGNILSAVVAAAAGTLDTDSQTAIAQRQIGTPQCIRQISTVRVHNRLSDIVATNIEAQGIEQATHISIILLVMRLDLRHCISRSQLRQERIAGSQIAFVAVTHIGGSNIGIIKCTGGAGTVGHEYQNRHPVIPGLPVVVTDNRVHFLEHLHSFKKARLNICTAAEGLVIVQVSICDRAFHIPIHRNTAAIQVQIHTVAAGGIAVNGQNPGDTLRIGRGTGTACCGIKYHANPVVLVGIQQGLNGRVCRIDQIPLRIRVAHRTGQVQHQHRISRNGGVAHHFLVGSQRRQGSQKVLVTVQHGDLAAEGTCILEYGLVSPDAAGVNGGQIVQIKILGPVVHGIGIHDPIVKALCAVCRRGHSRDVSRNQGQAKQNTQDSLSNVKLFHTVFLP